MNFYLVGGFNPLKNISQIGSSSQIIPTIGESKTCSKPPTSYISCLNNRVPWSPTCSGWSFSRIDIGNWGDPNICHASWCRNQWSSVVWPSSRGDGTNLTSLAKFGRGWPCFRNLGVAPDEVRWRLRKNGSLKKWYRKTDLPSGT
jgi:hypothetical protein